MKPIRYSPLAILAAGALCVSICFTGCFKTFSPVVTKPAASIVAGNADRAIQAQAIKLADKIDDPSKPYLHSIASALRANSGDIVNPADVQRIFADYGDPANQHKFKQLGADLWTSLRNALVQYGKVKGTELIASALNKSGSHAPNASPARTSTVADGP